MAETTSQRLKAFAIETLAFDLVGITTAEPPNGRAHLERWVAAGHHGEMGYMAETVSVRGNPRRLLPRARSLVCVAMSYHDAPEEAELTPRGGRVVVARYARRKDYHTVIKNRLVRLGRELATLAAGARWRALCDTAPLLEKELAQRAGLGWIGKNTCLINRRLGSELLLGELVTDVDLEPDRPEDDHCGRCTACLAVCPTAALIRPRVLDARRCIAYLTIEHRSELPAPLKPALGAHLFGCDICQAVCPWNRRARPRSPGALAPRAHLLAATVAGLRGFDAEAWHQFAAGTPLRRLDCSRFRRNLAVVADNATRAAESEQ
jgi:epoxyqueuosine reductase